MFSDCFLGFLLSLLDLLRIILLGLRLGLLFLLRLGSLNLLFAFGLHLDLKLCLDKIDY